jgi:hypothetical protein
MVPIDLCNHTLSKIRNIAQSIYTETTADIFRTFIGVFSLFRSGRLSANIKLIIHKTLLRSTMTYICPAWEFTADSSLEIAARPKRVSSHH